MHGHCLQFLLGFTIIPRETENNAYEKYLVGKQRTSWEMWKWQILQHQDQISIELLLLILPPSLLGLSKENEQQEFFDRNTTNQNWEGCPANGYGHCSELIVCASTTVKWKSH